MLGGGVGTKDEVRGTEPVAARILPQLDYKKMRD